MDSQLTYKDFEAIDQTGPDVGIQLLEEIAPEVLPNNKSPKATEAPLLPAHQRHKLAFAHASFGSTGDANAMTQDYIESLEALSDPEDREGRADVYFDVEKFNRIIRDEQDEWIAAQPLEPGETPDMRAQKVLDAKLDNILNPVRVNEVLEADSRMTNVTEKLPGDSDEPSDPQYFNRKNTNLSVRESLASIAAASQAQADPSVWNLLWGAVASALPYSDASIVKEIQEELTGDAPFFEFTSTRKQKLREHLQSLSTTELYEAYPKIVNVLSEANTYFGTDMDFSKVHLIEEVTATGNTEWWQVMIDDVIDLLDATVVGALPLKVLGKGSKVVANIAKNTPHSNAIVNQTRNQNAVLGAPSPTSLLGSQNATGSPPQAYVLAQAATSRAPSLKEALSQSQGITQHLNGFIPKDASGNTPTILSGIDPDIVRAAREVVATTSLTDAERAGRVAKEISALNKVKGVKLYTGLSETVENLKDGSFAIRAVYTNADGGTFSTLKEATIAAQDSGLATINQGAHIFKKNPSTGFFEYVQDPSSINPNTKGSFLFAVDNKYLYNPKDALAWDEQIVQNGLADLVGRGARYVSSPSELFIDSFAKKVLGISDTADAINTVALTKIKQKYFSLNILSQKKVTRALHEGDRQGVEYSDTDLTHTFGLDTKEIEGYRAARNLSNTQYFLDNIDLLKKLNDQGVELFEAPTGYGLPELRKTYVKPHRTPIERPDKDALYIDSKTGATAPIGTRGEMTTNIYDTGNYLAELATPYTVRGKEVKYILVNPREVTQRRLQAGTDYVLNYNPGQIHRVYNNHWFVDAVDKKTGKKVETLAAANSKARASKAVDELTRTNTDPNIVYRKREDRVDDLLDVSDLEDLDARTGGRLRSSQRHRGQVLKGIDSRGRLTGDADTLDPNQALRQISERIGNTVVRSGEISILKNRWLKTYGHLLDPSERGKFPVNATQISRLDGNNVEQAHARLLWKQIQHLEGADSIDTATKAWRTGLLRLADIIDDADPGYLRKKAQDGLQGLADANPINRLRSIPFALYMVLNPARQVLVQASQLLQMTFLDPRNAYRAGLGGPMFLAIRGHEEVMMKHALKGGNPAVHAEAKRMFNTMVRKQAKWMGLSEKDYLAFYRHFHEKSGIPQSVDHNIYVNNMFNEYVRDLNGNPMWTKTKAIGKGTLNVFRKAGFDLGERINLSGTYMAAFYRWRNNNPGVSIREPGVLEGIAQDARSMSLGMNQAGKFAWNDGLMGLFTQFLAVPVKMTAAMLPAKKLGGLGSSAFTTKEKWQLAAGNIIAFGASATGIQEILDGHRNTGQFGENISDDVWQVVEDGLLDVLLNKLTFYTFKTFGIEPPTSDIEFSDSFAATGAISMFGDRVSAFYRGDLAKFLGPATDLVFGERGKIRTVFNEVTYLVRSPEIEDMDRLTGVGRALLKLPSGTANILKWHWVRKYGLMEGKLGPTDASRSTADAVAYALGFQVEADTDKWNRIFAQKDLKDNTVEAAKEFAQAWSIIMKTRLNDPSWLEDESNRAFYKFLLDSSKLIPDESRSFFLEEVDRQINLMKKTDNPIAQLESWAMFGRGGAVGNAKYTIQNSKELPEDTKARLMKLFESAEEAKIEEEDASEWQSLFQR